MIDVKTPPWPLRRGGGGLAGRVAQALRRRWGATARAALGMVSAARSAARSATGSAAVSIAMPVAALLAAAAPASAQDGPQPPLPKVTLTAGMHRIEAEVARTPVEQARGLMHRREMGANQGMLFVYDAPQPLCFWMRNTVLPLTIAFIDDDGRIVNLRDMQPMTENSHCAERPVRFALEMHQGWFAKRGLKPGFRLRGGPFRP